MPKGHTIEEIMNHLEQTMFPQPKNVSQRKDTIMPPRQTPKITPMNPEQHKNFLEYLAERQTQDLMKLSGHDRETCKKALEDCDSAYSALKWLKQITPPTTHENPAKLQDSPYFQETLRQANKVLKEHDKMLKTSPCGDYHPTPPGEEYITPDNVQELCDGLSICTTCFDKLHKAGLVRQPDEICYGNGNTDYSEYDCTDYSDDKRDQMQGYRLKMSYDDLVFVKGQLQQLNDDGTIDDLNYTINCLNRAMQLLNVAIKSHGLNPQEQSDGFGPNNEIPIGQPGTCCLGTEIQEAANYSTVDEVNTALDDLIQKSKPKPITSDEADDAIDEMISSSLKRAADDFKHGRGTVRNTGERPSCCLDTTTLLGECDNALDFLNDCITYTQEDENQSGINVCMHVARKSIERVKAALNMKHRIARNNEAPDLAPNNPARNCCTEFNEQSTRYTPLPDYVTTALNANNIAWTKLADQYEKLLNQTSLLTHLILKDKPNDQPDYGNDPYAPSYDSDKPIGSFVPRRCGGS